MSIRAYSLLFCIFIAPFAQACGPWLPEAYVLRNDDVFYAPPQVGFAAELRHLLPESVPHQAVLESDDARAVDELRSALEDRGIDGEAASDIVDAYQAFRQQLNSIKPYLETAPFVYYASPVDEAQRRLKLQELQTLEVPATLPDEFYDYLSGALAYYRQDISGALKKWQAVLSLPETDRQYRSVMAAYMIAKACPDCALEYYRYVRELVEAGYADGQGLAAASYGKEARVQLDRGQHRLAIDLYLKQWTAGYSNAARSLYLVAEDVWHYPYAAQLASLVQDEQSRAVLTAYILTQSEFEDADKLREQFLEVLPDVKLMRVEEAGRFALMEYQRNNLSATRLWVSYAAPEDALALWVQSKLLLRAGKIEEGRTLMMALTEEMSAHPEKGWRLDTRRAWAELGLLMLRDERYLETADAFWKARSWQDCAYVLERLLTTDELVAWVQANPAAIEETSSYFDGKPRALLARRLMREARFDQALPYFDAATRAEAERYMEAMQLASDTTQAPELRARHYWTAARIMRDYGMELVGAELAPDYAWLDGSFQWEDIPDARRQNYYRRHYQVNEATRAEFDLIAQTRILPDKRFHYRHRAVQLAELAAGLLPNQSEDAARIYCVAGNWIKLRDPAEADRLFKQLVVRCFDTELGQAAAESNWFPQVDLESIEPFEQID
jgi:hypothetical protein